MAASGRYLLRLIDAALALNDDRLHDAEPLLQMRAQLIAEQRLPPRKSHDA